MKKGDFIFVYGTLRRGERMDLQKQTLNFGVTYCCDDAINGKMYHLGAYPGVKLEGDFHVWNPSLPSVKGEVFRIRATAIVAVMDAYEGYVADAPDSGLYNRHQVETADGKLVWVYAYNGFVTSDQLIEGGDWVKNKHLLIRERRFGT